MAVTGAVAGFIAGALMARSRTIRAVARRRWLARQPAPTFVFADLVGYTALTEERGDQAAARVARRFGREISTLSRRHGALHVKSLGDGAMICAPDAAQALALAERAVRELGTRPDLLPLRVGVHTGRAVLDGGDWYGGAVNLAARLAQMAQPNEVLVSHATRSASGEYHPGWLVAQGELGLRGLTRPVAVWRLSGRTEARHRIPRSHLRLVRP
jgi:class 3 adenylate cyclase